MSWVLIKWIATLYLLMRNRKGLKKNTNHYWMCNSFLKISHFDVNVIFIICLFYAKNYLDFIRNSLIKLDVRKQSLHVFLSNIIFKVNGNLFTLISN